MNEVKTKAYSGLTGNLPNQNAGVLDNSWSNWTGVLTITIECEGDGPPVTILIDTVYQAAMQGLLRRL